jgi:sugar-specific transcriptional regulator TrmB
VDQEAIDSLQQLGLSLYEARLYLGLLAYGPQNGHELSRTSRVPSSKVYATLDKLVGVGIVQQRRQGTSLEYVCVPPDELLSRLRGQYARPLEYLENALPSLAQPRVDTDVLRLIGERTILDRANVVIDDAREELYLSIWDDQLEALHDSLSAALDRGVRMFMMIFGDVDFRAAFSVQHSDRERVSMRIGGEMLTVVADGRTALIGHVPKQGEASGVITQNPVLCLMAEEYLRHDLILEKAKTMPRFDEWNSWLESDKNVRAIRLGRGSGKTPVAVT